MKHSHVYFVALAICSQLSLCVHSGLAADAAAKIDKLQDSYVQAARSRIIDDYIPCEVDGKTSAGLKPQKVSGDIKPKDLSGMIDYLSTFKHIHLDKNVFADKLRTVITSPTGMRQAVEAGIQRDPGQSEQQVVENATEAVTLLDSVVADELPPADIACTMTMLPWTVAADSFGRHVADQFIAFQVVVRNLNTSDEFLMHNVSVAIDATGAGRFYSGVDKMVVRNTQNHGQNYDRRNFLVRLLETAGDIAAGAAPYGSVDTQSGIAVFRAAFIPGVEKGYPDRYTSQINALNDLGFSSSSAYKIVVPVKGSAPFVTFLPADIFSRNPSQPASASSRKKKEFHYKYWPPSDLNSFLEASYVAVSGIHVQEVKNTSPSLTTIDCHGTPKTAINVQSPSCDVQGQNLDKAGKLRLEDSSGAPGPTADGAITLASGQTASGTVTFSGDDLNKLTGNSYNVALVRADNGAEIQTSVTVTIAVSVPSSPALSLSIGSAGCAPTDCSVTMTGTGLTQVKQVLLFDPADTTKPLASADVTGTPTSITAHFTNLSSVKTAKTYLLSLRNAGTELASSSVSVTIAQ